MPNAQPCQSETAHAVAVRDLMPGFEAMKPTSLSWVEASDNPYKVGAAYAVTRQIECLRAALTLGERELGHLATTFVRPACEEFLWISYLASISQQDASEAFVLMSISDNWRSLLAARNYIGVPTLVGLGFPADFLEATETILSDARDRLSTVGTRLGWDRKVSPTTRWVAIQVHEEPLYEYLHAVSSRMIHFSPGEALRHGWGDPQGLLDVSNPAEELFLSDFALDELTHLLIRTMLAAQDWIEQSGPGEQETSWLDQTQTFASLGRVPIVRADEFALAWRRLPDQPTS